jgi:hypothetical protein
VNICIREKKELRKKKRENKKRKRKKLSPSSAGPTPAHFLPPLSRTCMSPPPPTAQHDRTAARPPSRRSPSLPLTDWPHPSAAPASLSHARSLSGTWGPTISPLSLTRDRHRCNRHQPLSAPSPRHYSLTSKVWHRSSPRAVTVYPHTTVPTEPSHCHHCAAIIVGAVRLAGARQSPLLPSSVRL